MTNSHRPTLDVAAILASHVLQPLRSLDDRIAALELARARRRLLRDERLSILATRKSNIEDRLGLSGTYRRMLVPDVFGRLEATRNDLERLMHQEALAAESVHTELTDKLLILHRERLHEAAKAQLVPSLSPLPRVKHDHRYE